MGWMMEHNWVVWFCSYFPSASLLPMMLSLCFNSSFNFLFSALRAVYFPCFKSISFTLLITSVLLCWGLFPTPPLKKEEILHDPELGSLCLELWSYPPKLATYKDWAMFEFLELFYKVSTIEEVLFLLNFITDLLINGWPFKGLFWLELPTREFWNT